MKDVRIVCVLSGGGAKAAAQAGAVRALLEAGGTPRHYVGTSMGAVVAALFACGLEYETVRTRMASLSRRDVAVLSPSVLLGPFATAFLRAGPLRKTIARLVPATGFEDLAVPLTVTAVDEDTGALALFGAGGRTDVTLPQALYASCALPAYYPPQRIGGRRYIDGGVRSVLPLDVAGTFAPEMVFAVRTGPSFAAEPAERPTRLPPMVRAYGKALRILMAAQTDAEIDRWTNGPVPLVLVEPTVRQEATFAVDQLLEFLEEGYRSARQALDAWVATR